MLQELAARGGRLSAFEARYVKGDAYDWLRSLGLPVGVSDSSAALVTLWSPDGRRQDWEETLTQAGLTFKYCRGMYFVDFGRVRNLRTLAAALR